MSGRSCTLSLALVICIQAPCLYANVYTTSVQLGQYGSTSIAAWTAPNLSGDGAFLSYAIDTNGVLRPIAGSVGIGHVWYTVNQGTAIDASFATSSPSFFSAFSPNYSNRISMTVNQSFLLGFWLDEHHDQIPVPDSGDRYGWARLHYTGSNLVLESSAIDDSGSGIFAGTTLVVPAAARLFMVGGGEEDASATLSVSGTVGAAYSIEYTSSLFTNKWNSLTNIVLTNSVWLFSDIDTTSTPTRFYHAVREMKAGP